jgi:hypothetical protein
VLNGLGASDAGGSGILQMRFSNNSSAWSAWEPYAETRANWKLFEYGGDSTEGRKTVSVQYRDLAGNASSSYQDSIVYVSSDLAFPQAPIQVTSAPAGWTNTNSFLIDWTNPTDPSGITAAWYKRGSVPVSPSDGTRTTSKPFSTSANAEGGQAIYVWLENGEGKKNHGKRDSTSLWYDGTAPVNGTISVNNDADTTESLVVLLSTLGGSDLGGSGLSEMRFSNNNNTWSPWEPYANTKSGWDLTSFGGNANEGQKTVYVQYRDLAGNGSQSFQDVILYISPKTPPNLLSPANNAIDQPVSPTLNWSVSPGATAYHLQVSTSSVFASLIVNDSSISTTSQSIGPLQENSVYYWRVSARSVFGEGLFSPARTFTTIPNATVATSISFSDPSTPTSYRLFSIPGITATTVRDIIPLGDQKIDWRVYRETGGPGSTPVDYLVELSGESILNTGEGYWLLKKNNLGVNRTVTMPRLVSDGSYSIPLHPGWNIVGNPFDRPVSKIDLMTLNGIPKDSVLYDFAGAYADGGTVLQPFKGYYFFNALNLTTLKVPYPFTPVLPRVTKGSTVGWRLQLVFDGGLNRDEENYVGVAASAAVGCDAFDTHKPPLVFDLGFLYFRRPEWDSTYSLFNADIRPEIGDGQVWEFETSNPGRADARITVRGLEQVSAEHGVWLVNMKNTVPFNVRQHPDYPFKAVSERTPFKLIVGKKSFVEEELAKYVPATFTLGQNYPNPFNPTTTIMFQVAHGNDVRVEIVSILGEHIKDLVHERLEAASYTVVWDGTDQAGGHVATGVYFYRLIAGGNVIQTRKMVFVK